MLFFVAVRYFRVYHRSSFVIVFVCITFIVGVISEIYMPKMKTNSGAKKRFSATSSGLIKFKKAGKRHGMIKRSPSFIRKTRKTAFLTPGDVVLMRSFLPYLRGK